MTAWRLDSPIIPSWGAFTADEMLQLAWLCEKAARGCDVDGKLGWGEQLRRDASALRATAMGERPE